jgi:LuxR family transcriptional regulator, maltose regulon positive regulatory protein
MPRTILSLAKTTRPTLSMVLNRERIFKKLDNKKDAKAVWITGPPGSGKTTLIASYLSAQNSTSLWYQFDSDDADIATFFYYLRRTALKHSEESKSNIPNLPAEKQDYFNYGCRLFRAIFSRYNDPLMIVFDNYDSLPQHSDLHKILANAINEVPKNSKVVFVSRLDPFPAFARAIVNKSLYIINSDDLKLDEQEYNQLAKLRKVKISDEDLKYAYELSDGWVTGFILTLEYSRQSMDYSSDIFRKSKSILFNYLADEVFSNFDNITQNFLLTVCWTRRLSIKMAKAISNEPKAHHLLSNLACNNYFVTERDDTNYCEYIIHPLMRDFLQSQARKSFTESKISEILKNTAEILINEEQPEEAVELMVANHSWDRLESIISQHAPLLIQQGRTSLLTKWLEELPYDRLYDNGWLLYWFGKSRRTESPREARNYFESAFRCFENNSANEIKGKILSCCGIIESIILETDDYRLLDNWISIYTRLISDNTEFSKLSDSKYVDVIVLILITLVIRNQNKCDLTGWFQRADQAIHQIPHTNNRYQYELLLIMAYTLTGNFERSGDLLAAQQKNNALNNDNPDFSCKYFLFSSLNEFLRGDCQAAEKSAAASLIYAQEYSLHNLLPYIYACHCGSAISQGNLERANEWLSKLSFIASTSQRLIRFLNHYLHSWYALVNEDTIKAYHEQRQAQTCAAELGITLLEVLSNTALAQLLFLCRDTRAGTAQLRRVHSMARDIQNPLLEFMTLLIYAEVAMNEGRISSGINALRYALGLGRTNGYYHIPWWHPQQLADICVIALRNKIETEYVRDLIIHRNLQFCNPPIDIQEWPWPLRLSTLGEFEIKHRNEEKPADIKRQGRPLQLLKVLLALGSREVPADDIAEILWPHVDSDYSNKSLTINLHRLRRILGNEDIILLRNNCISLNSDFVWLDIWALEYIVNQIKTFKNESKQNYNTSELDNYAERLLYIYQGPFLKGDNEKSCFVTSREHYRKNFLIGLEMLADIAEVKKDYSRIITLYESGIDRDPAAELLYHQLIILYRNQNKVKDAIEVYERCRTAMVNTPQEKPSNEIIAIYNSLPNVSEFEGN